MAEIKILISPDGKQIKGDVTGVTGTGCNKLLAPVEEMGGVKQDRKKPEYYQQSNTQKVNA